MVARTHPGATGRRLRVGLGASLREFVRQPLNLVLLVGLPPLVIVSYGSMMDAFPRLPYMTTAPSTLGAMAGTLFVAAFLPGVIGLFQVISARRGDDRLAIAGFPRSVLFATRFLTVVVASLVTAAIALGVLLTRTDVASVGPAYASLAFVGVLYGLIGMLVGALVPRELEGSLVLIFLADVDEALASGIVATESALPKAFPLHYPHEVFSTAVGGGTVATGDVLAAGAYGGAVFVVALVAYARLTGDGGIRG